MWTRVLCVVPRYSKNQTMQLGVQVLAWGGGEAVGVYVLCQAPWSNEIGSLRGSTPRTAGPPRGGELMSAFHSTACALGEGAPWPCAMSPDR